MYDSQFCWVEHEVEKIMYSVGVAVLVVFILVFLKLEDCKKDEGFGEEMLIRVLIK